jgi:hypothetical protein
VGSGTRTFRRRLTAPGPGPTRLRTEIKADSTEDEEDEGKREEPTGEVSPDEARLALVPAKSHSPAPIINGISRSIVEPPILEGPLRWLTLALFVAKMVLLMVPCSPYLCSSRVFWPLLGLAVLDLQGYLISLVKSCITNCRRSSLRRSSGLLLVHVGIMYSASHFDVLCPYNYSHEIFAPHPTPL